MGLSFLKGSLSNALKFKKRLSKKNTDVLDTKEISFVIFLSHLSKSQ